jgi:triacylglycerol esterase/lipase EstA (alpha/beta hydrolase family)
MKEQHTLTVSTKDYTVNQIKTAALMHSDKALFLLEKGSENDVVIKIIGNESLQGHFKKSLQKVKQHDVVDNETKKVQETILFNAMFERRKDGKK